MCFSSYNHKVLDSFPSFRLPDVPVGGRLKYFTSAWYKLTHDPSVIEMVTSCPIELSSVPTASPCRKITLNKSETAIARDHIKELLDKKAIEYVDSCDGEFVSSVFLCPKKDGRWRLILSLREFNFFVKKIRFKMGTLHSILHLIEPSMYMSSIDLQDGFLVVPIKPGHRLYMRFIFDNKLMQYVVLPFGYTRSPRIFTKILRPLVSRLRALGYIVTFYLDDSWQGGYNYSRCLNTCIATFTLLCDCGFIPNLNKSTLVPCQKILILGTYLDSVKMEITLPDDKVQGTLKMIESALKGHHISIRDLARLIGKLYLLLL